MKFVAFGRTDVGRKRVRNEDNFLVNNDRGLFVVADGMGGHANGELASSIVIETFKNIADGTLESCIKTANSTILNYPGGHGMGSTVVAMQVTNDHVTWSHVGDSRAYMVRDGRIRQLTKDHSANSELLDAGVSPEKVKMMGVGNIITRACGIHGKAKADTKSWVPIVGDVFLLCSDGLTNEVDDDMLLLLMTGTDDPGKITNEMINAANANGGRDNITAIVVKVL